MRESRRHFAIHRTLPPLALAFVILLAAPATGGPVRYRLTELIGIAPAALNNRGQVAGVGSSAEEDVPSTASIWENGSVRALDPRVWSAPTDINDTGQVVGYIADNDRSSPFLYANGVLRDLGSSGDMGAAEGLNNSGTVVGWTGSMTQVRSSAPRASPTPPAPAPSCMRTATCWT